MKTLKWLNSFIVVYLCISDKLYANNSAKVGGAPDSGSSVGYGTFYPESSSSTVSYSAPPSSSSSTQSYQSMPPPADQQSPYSYGYGDEKKKMLTQGSTEGQGGNYSMYSTAYPSSVTGGQSYNNNNNNSSSTYGGWEREGGAGTSISVSHKNVSHCSSLKL